MSRCRNATDLTGMLSLDSQVGKDVDIGSIHTGMVKNESVSTHNIWNHGGY